MAAKAPAKPKMKWSWEADYIQGCNCDYGCPCEYEAPPTMGFCDGIGAYRINQGSYGETKLDGLGFAYWVHSPKALHLGNLTLGVVVDEKATQAQRDAMLTIASGKAGGMPFEIIAQLVGKMLDPVYAPFDFKIKGRESSVKVGNILDLSVTPIKNPVTGEPEHMRLEHETGFIFKGAEIVAAKTCKSTHKGLKFSHPNKAGFITKISYHN